jgi:hypothetical protein
MGRRAPAALAAGVGRRGRGEARRRQGVGRRVAGGAWGGGLRRRRRWPGRRVAGEEATVGEARLGETAGRRSRVSVVCESERGEGEGCRRPCVASLPSARDLALGKEFFLI